MATTYSTYRWGLCLLKVLAIENMPTRFLAHVYYGQTAGWIRTLLDAEVRLGPGDIVLDGDPAPTLRKRAQQNPLFRPLLWPVLLTSQYAAGGCRGNPTDNCHPSSLGLLCVVIHLH